MEIFTVYIPTKAKQQFRFKYVVEIFFWKLVKELKQHKGTNIINLPSNLMKDCFCEIFKLLSFTINLTLKTGIIPTTEWKTATGT